MIRSIALLVICCWGAAASAQTTQPAPAPREVQAAVRLTLDLDENAFDYEAIADRLTLADDAGKPQAHFFFVAYNRVLSEGERVEDRPIMFVFNGGPGAAAVWLHLGVAGPKTIALGEDGMPLPPPASLIDNPHTWLDVADLVFIDPVGTGFSRAAEGVDAKRFYGVDEDVRAVADFIRLYLNRYGRWGSPKFLAGESYGTTRAAALAEHLLDTHGVALNGVALISTVLDFATLRPGDNNTLPYVLYLPAYTATAHYHGQLPPELQDRELAPLLREVEQWALTRYVAALALGDRLPEPQRREVAQTLQRFTGLPVGLIERSGLRVAPGLFMKELLRDGRRVVGRFDSRITGFSLEPVANWPEYDPSLSYYLPVYSSAFNHYVRSVLGYESDLKYEVLSDRVWPWNFEAAGEGYLDVSGRLQAAMAKQPTMKVLIASGLYDLATPYLGADYTVDHLDLSPTLRENLKQTYYPAGHMMYHDRASLRALSEDIAAFVRAATPRPTTP